MRHIRAETDSKCYIYFIFPEIKPAQSFIGSIDRQDFQMSTILFILNLTIFTTHFDDIYIYIAAPLIYIFDNNINRIIHK